MGHVSTVAVGKGGGIRALSNVSRVGRHADELCYVACDVLGQGSGDGSRYEWAVGNAPYVVTFPWGICRTTP